MLAKGLLIFLFAAAVLIVTLWFFWTDGRGLQPSASLADQIKVDPWLNYHSSKENVVTKDKEMLWKSSGIQGPFTTK